MSEENVGGVEPAAPEVVVETVEAPEAPSRSSGEAAERALRKAFEGREPADKAEAPEMADEPASGPLRGPDGKFVAKDVVADAPPPTETPGEPAQELPKSEAAAPAPERFSAEAKAVWGTLPEAARAEVLRMQRELEGGLTQYRQRYEPLRQHMEMAERQGVNLAEVLNGYISAENMIRRDPAAGFEHICQGLGISFRDVAAAALGQPAPEKDAVIDGLRQELHALKSQVGTVSQTFEQQRQSQVTDFVTKFAAERPRFNELSGEIAAMLKTGFATSLEDAYDKAERLKPAPAPAAPAAPPPVAQTPAPPRKADLSISGSPGSNPAPVASKSNAEALTRAFARHGLGI